MDTDTDMDTDIDRVGPMKGGSLMRRLRWRAFGVAARIGFRLALATACLLLVAAPARAEVVLSTSVQRVVLTADGVTERLEETSVVSPGDVLRYTIYFENTSPRDVAAGTVVITNPLPEGTEYLEGTATGEQTRITFSVDGETFAAPSVLSVADAGGRRAATAADYRSIRWIYQPGLPAGASGQVSFDLRMR